MTGLGACYVEMTALGGPQAVVIGLDIFQLPAVFVAFAAGGFQVEHQVFHVEPELAQGVLDERQNPAAAERALFDAIEVVEDRFAVLGGEGGQGVFEFHQVGGKLFGGGRLEAGDLGHGCRSG